MNDGTYRGRWVDEVFRTPLITDAVRVALLALATDMDDAGMAVVRRDEIANRLGRSDRRIGDRLKAGIEAGYLERVSRGQRNGDSRYQATIPDHLSSGHPGVPKTADLLRTPGGPEDDSLQDSPQVQENPPHQDTRESSRGAFDPSIFGTPGGPQDDDRIYKDRARAPITADRSKTTADVTGHGDAKLFDEKSETPPPAGAGAPDTKSRAITAQTIVTAWITAVEQTTGERPTKALIGQIGRGAKDLIGDERDGERLVAAATSLGRKIGNGYTDLGREYLMAASKPNSTGVNGVLGHGQLTKVNGIHDWSKGGPRL